jgi:hypothetical protein
MANQAKQEIKVSEADRAAAKELCELWIPLSREEEVAEIIAKHVGDEELREQLRTAQREIEELGREKWKSESKTSRAR